MLSTLPLRPEPALFLVGGGGGGNDPPAEASFATRLPPLLLLPTAGRFFTRTDGFRAGGGGGGAIFAGPPTALGCDRWFVAVSVVPAGEDAVAGAGAGVVGACGW